MFDLERDEPVKTVRINSSKSEQLSQSSEFLTSNKWNSSQSRSAILDSHLLGCSKQRLSIWTFWDRKEKAQGVDYVDLDNPGFVR